MMKYIILVITSVDRKVPRRWERESCYCLHSHIRKFSRANLLYESVRMGQTIQPYCYIWTGHIIRAQLYAQTRHIEVINSIPSFTFSSWLTSLPVNVYPLNGISCKPLLFLTDSTTLSFIIYERGFGCHKYRFEWNKWYEGAHCK